MRFFSFSISHDLPFMYPGNLTCYVAVAEMLQAKHYLLTQQKHRGNTSNMQLHECYITAIRIVYCTYRNKYIRAFTGAINLIFAQHEGYVPAMWTKEHFSGNTRRTPLPCGHNNISFVTWRRILWQVTYIAFIS